MINDVYRGQFSSNFLFCILNYSPWCLDTEYVLVVTSDFDSIEVSNLKRYSKGRNISILVNFCSNFLFFVMKYSPRSKDKVSYLCVVSKEELVEILSFKRLVENIVFFGTLPS